MTFSTTTRGVKELDSSRFGFDSLVVSFSAGFRPHAKTKTRNNMEIKSCLVRKPSPVLITKFYKSYGCISSSLTTSNIKKKIVRNFEKELDRCS